MEVCLYEEDTPLTCKNANMTDDQIPAVNGHVTIIYYSFISKRTVCLTAV